MKECPYKYDRFLWRKSWADFEESLSIDERLYFGQSIAGYGLDETEPARLKGRALEYFNKTIRPDLDRQHRKADRDGKQPQNNPKTTPMKQPKQPL